MARSESESSFVSTSDQSSSSAMDSSLALTPETSYNEGATLPDKPNVARDHIYPLEQYIPLGCLRCAHTIPMDTSDWAEIHEINLLAGYIPSNHLLGLLERLLAAQWIRITAGAPAGLIIIRIYALPEDLGHATIDRGSRSLRSALTRLVAEVDVSRGSWKGRPRQPRMFDLWATRLPYSLFWIFNTLPSPKPSADRISNRFSRLPVEQLLDGDPYIPGLKAKLFPYQARSVAAMIQRETSPEKVLDPRFERRMSPDGLEYFYNPRDMKFRQQPIYYEGSRGGILAETMGVGKTLMCLTLILATKYSLPRVPPQHFKGVAVRENVGTLAQMASSNAGRYSVSAKAHFSWFYPDLDLQRCLAAVESEWPSYEIPDEVRRSHRTRSVVPPPRRLKLCSATIIVVPRNLIHQWEAEIKKHVSGDETGLKVLILKDTSQKLAPADNLLQYDVILFSKSRFEKEHDDGSDNQGRTSNFLGTECRCPYIGATRIRDCTCMKPEDIYSSPLKELHFLRIIIDEGHEFSNKSSRAVVVATQLVKAERRWVVSGTPAKERLFGVDIELAAHSMTENYFPGATKEEEQELGSSSSMRAAALKQQSVYDKEEEKKGAATPIGVLLGNYLQVRPWATTEGEAKLEWEDYFFRHENSRLRTHDAFSLCLKATLEAIVIKTQPDDIEKDVVLPRLEHRVVYLDPCFYDTATTNLFTTFLTANAVTSERTDVDYLFHKNSAKSLHTLIRNLRQSNFFWTGWTEKNIIEVLSHGLAYLTKSDTKCTEEDKFLLNQCLGFAETIYDSIGWKALSATQELGIFVNAWPEDSMNWALNGKSIPTMIGSTHLRTAQKFVNDRLALGDPTEGLQECGTAEIDATITANQTKKPSDVAAAMMMGVPSTGLQGVHLSSPKKARPGHSEKGSIGTAHRKASKEVELDPSSPLALPSIVGTTSSKMSYLLGRVMALQTSEKILIFYDADPTAYYIAQCLDLVHIKHLIYAKTLRPEQRSTYIVAFDTDPTIRVLLMDIDTGALGLNVNKASRVFFINPPCKPHQEAQAIKRAHRIGQDKPVFVETLILRGTIEEAMFERSKSMTREEHVQADKELLNDSKIAQIIQAARILPITGQDGIGWRQIAPLDTPLQIFGRKGRSDMKIKGIDAEEDRTGTEKLRIQLKRKRPARSGGEGKSKRAKKGERESTSGTTEAGPSSSSIETATASTGMYNKEERSIFG